MSMDPLGSFPNGLEHQRELLKEAERLHVAARAVREARVEKAVHPPAAFPAGTGSMGAPHRGLLQRRPTGWQAAAHRLGGSLVAVGHRLERVGRAEKEPPSRDQLK